MVRDPARPDPLLSAEDLVESFQPVIGQSVTLRPLQPGDAEIERRFVTGLSERTRYNRLLGGAMKITDAYIRRLIEVDQAREVALAAVTMLEGAELIIGVARYALEAGGRSCEFALVIADAWQGRGIGRRMLAKLISVARARGLAEMYGDVLSTNRPMLELARRLGFSVTRHPDDATLARVSLAL
ncbi:MAG: GNAT family N-acetyltransferase [Burkholderiales bacterium]|nr:GNAT family N-acetyltransferase [Burkholderiales bacterium]